jgi:hypothetical protein
MENCNRQRGEVAIGRPDLKPDVAGSLATSGSYRRCLVVVHMATDTSLMAVQGMLMERRSQVAG